MPDCWLSVSNPYISDGYEQDNSAASTARRTCPKTMSSSELAHQVQRDMRLLYLSDGLASDILDAISNAFLSLVNAFKAAKASASEVVHFLFRMDESEQGQIPIGKNEFMEVRSASMPIGPHSDKRAEMREGLSSMRAAIYAQEKAAQRAPRKGRTAAGTVIKGFSEFPYMKAILGQQQHFMKMPRPVQRHLLTLYEFLGVQNAVIRQQVDALLWNFLEFGELLSAQTADESWQGCLDHCAGMQKQMLTDARKFAEIWLDARKRAIFGNACAEMRYTHVAAFDFLAAGILRNFPDVLPEDVAEVQILDVLVNDIPSSGFYFCLSMQVPKHIEDIAIGDVPDDPDWLCDSTRGRAKNTVSTASVIPADGRGAVEVDDTDLWTPSGLGGADL